MPAGWLYAGAIVMMAVPVILLVEHIKNEKLKHRSRYESLHENDDEDDINLESRRGPVPPPYQPGESSLSNNCSTRQPWALNSREARLEREEQQAYEEFQRLQLLLREKQIAEREEKLKEYQAKIQEQKELLKKYGEDI